MKKRFIICLNENTSTEQDKLFINYINENKVAWWHWLATTWLITDTNGKLTASEIRSKLKEIFPNNYNMVFEFRDDKDTWAGFGKNNGDENMFEWIKNNWED
ncbi:hypothetical protein CLU96_4537 [Chryseobacterium sp. 52]|uniref:hypothetical protein n=1 Tax=Chryseobacterium sp. 52 TaxID=2035213 RepID=UPI000C173E4B|nr:hypothetical protein [Chryseobacterium sp. 52]PIF47479.1 hypothetical protein CLU96_4537 [Chryseobacterium sp. 52]